MKIGSFKQNEQKANEGVVHHMDDTGKCYIRVARFGNPLFEAEIRKLYAPYKSYRKSKMSEEIQERLTNQGIAKAILLEMVGFEDDAGDITGTKGAVIEDTYENRLKVLSNKNYSEFKDLVSAISLDFEQYKSQQEAEDEGKSESSSSGSGPGAVTSTT